MNGADPKTGLTPEVPVTSGEETVAQAEEGEVPAGEPEAPVGPTESPGNGSSRESDDEPGPGAADPDPERDHEAELEHDLEELAAKAQKADEYLELAKRTRADFENFRKRAARDSAAAQQRGVVKLVKELLPAVDNLDRALAAAQSADGSPPEETLVSGIKLVHAEVLAALGRAGVERFSPEGAQFDPASHEALAQQPTQGAKPGTVVEVYQCGYRLGEAVIRPARVLVAG
jgi:molecular chaperone GrpE